MKQDDNEFLGYLRFSGPTVNEGKMNIGKMGVSLVSLNKVFKKYIKTIANVDENYELKVSGLQKGSTEIQIIIEQITPFAEPIFNAYSYKILLETFGITEFGKQFFGTLAQQLVLKVFSCGKKLKEGKKTIENDLVFVTLTNVKEEEKIVKLSDWENYKTLYSDSEGLVQIDPGEKMVVGFQENNKKVDLASISYSERKYFDSNLEESIEERANDQFDYEKAEPVKIVGRFIDFYGLAQKYPFAFQARRQQEVFGKQKILCIVNAKDISNIIDYLKPNNSKDLCIHGKATKDFDGKIDKIKIDWFSEDPDFNPEQISII